ncbi:hypothetical protein F5B18DRAFT_631200 [Nemania serpens]|nr:hypothetical protein F5B18DRAFT_631200 [Nemania serpens]
MCMSSTSHVLPGVQRYRPMYKVTFQKMMVFISRGICPQKLLIIGMSLGLPISASIMIDTCTEYVYTLGMYLAGFMYGMCTVPKYWRAC